MRRTAALVALGLAAATVAGAAPPVTDADAGTGAVFDAFVEFARHPTDTTWSAVPFSRRVELGLANRLLVSRSARELRAPRAWRLDVALFRGGSGPFSAIRTVARESRPLTIGTGAYRRCVSPAGRPPPRVASLTRLSVQPLRVESCLQWWSVDPYVTRAGRVRAVTLDLWEP